MLENIVSVVLGGVGVYAALGILFVAAFHVGGAVRVDPAIKGAGFFFRLLITPGVVALWPLLVVRWRKAATGRPIFGAVHRPVSAQGLRSLHRRLSLALLVIVPILAILGLALRPGAPPLDAAVRSTLPEPAALSAPAATFDDAFPSLPVSLGRRTAADGTVQLELDVAADLGIPALVLYWTPDDAASFPRSAVFLGSVWGPGTRRYALPSSFAQRNGTLVLYSMARAEIIGSFTIPSTAGR